MLLTKLHYLQNCNEPTYWEIKDVILGKINLIVGLNATGKTRMMNVLKNLARQISGELSKLLVGDSELTFKKGDTIYQYLVSIQNAKVQKERFTINGKNVLERSLDKGIIHDSDGHKKSYEPPADKLTLHVRRDKKEYPYLEDLFYWAQNYYGFMFNSASPGELFVGNFTENRANLESLSTIPQLLQGILGKEDVKEQIICDMKSIGYPLKDISLRSGLLKIVPLPSTVVHLQEEGLSCETNQLNMSAGMYRALGMIVVVNYLHQKKDPCTFAVDDIGEGLDFTRSSQLVKLILKRTEDAPIQIIFTSNDRHLLNAVDVDYWNVLERQGHVVKSHNYHNNKKVFDEFMMTGLSNFELLAGLMYKEVSQ